MHVHTIFLLNPYIIFLGKAQNAPHLFGYLPDWPQLKFTSLKLYKCEDILAPIYYSVVTRGIPEDIQEVRDILMFFRFIIIYFTYLI